MPSHIHQDVFIKASPADVYSAFMNEKQHSAFSGGKSQISTEPGGEAIMHDGQITARNIELEPGRKIVQAWRVAPWEEGQYTLLRIMLAAESDGTRITLDQTGCPEEMTDHLADGWEARYWTPLRTYFENR
ncbi:SRPBCC domain-containing protein [Pararhizobium sp. IMCC21322]|uniref:SRPBCC domain-containing protein n=1 Tax=Pararhizobium sp. IMCC21322 TaxID=3067903 RepID=UPI0027422FE0|nr:SRPBCC domain-containing protein [Pararhizobium sp. IMCC21322]